MSGPSHERDDDLAPGALRAAFEAVREEHQGEHAEPDATLRHVLLATRKRARSTRLVRWFVIPAAAVLTASTAWAGATGQLGVVVDRMREVMQQVQGDEPEAGRVPSGASRSPATTPAAPATSASAPLVPSELAPEPAPESAVEPAPSALSAPPAPVRVAPVGSARAPLAPTPPAPATAATAPEPVAIAPAPRPSSSGPPDPHGALYEEAHRLHFAERDPARALAAWDRYLAVAPSGRFAPEARYNRALSLVRLGRHDEARRELAAIAGGSLGGYRREDARVLLEALDRDR